MTASGSTTHQNPRPRRSLRAAWRLSPAESRIPKPEREPETSSLQYPRPFNRGLLVSLAAATLVLLFYQLGDYRTLGKHEAFAVVPAREMLRTGDWIVPRFGGLPRLEKPPLAYWVLAVTGRTFGRIDELTSRVPATFASLGVAVLTGCWAARSFGAMAGLGTAVAFLSSIFAMTYARRAEVDMLLCLITTAALLLMATPPEGESPGRRFVRSTAFLALVALSWMAKFHYGPVMILGPTLTALTLQRRWRSLRSLANPLGWALVAAAVWGWSSLVERQIPEARAIWETQTIGRVVGKLGGEPWWFYFEQVVVQTLPWTPMALLAVVASWKAAWPAPEGSNPNEPPVESVERNKPSVVARIFARIQCGDPREQFLWIWLLTQFAILSASAGKHSHYLAACLPMVSILAGRGVARVVERIREGHFEWDRSLAIGGAIAMAAASLGLTIVLSRRWPDRVPAALLLGGCMAIGGLLTNWLTYRKRYVAACHALILSVMASYAIAGGHLMPAEDFRRHAARYASELRKEAGESETIYTYSLGSDPLLAYLGARVQRLENQEMVRRALQEHGTLQIVTAEPQLPALMPFGRLEVLSRIPAEYRKSDRRVPALMTVRLTAAPAEPESPLRSEVRHARRE